MIPIGSTYNKNAIDYSRGVIITDGLTGEIYEQEEAEKQTNDIKHRLINKPVKIGCWVVKEWK